MPQPYSQGAFCWMELGTTDAAGAKTFYTHMFGWIANDVPVSPDFSYTVFKLHGSDAAGMYQLMADQRQRGIPPHWLPYIAVDNVDAMAPRVAELGGKVVAGPHDAGENGRLLIAHDPTGGHFGLWQAYKHVGAGAGSGSGTYSWSELVTRDVPVARDFYVKLLGYDVTAAPMGSGEYTMLVLNGTPVAGLFPMPDSLQGVPPHWMVYFNVEDPDNFAEAAGDSGAKTLVPPTDIPGVGRFSTFTDPQGAAFSVIQLSSSAAA